MIGEVRFTPRRPPSPPLEGPARRMRIEAAYVRLQELVKLSRAGKLSRQPHFCRQRPDGGVDAWSIRASKMGRVFDGETQRHFFGVNFGYGPRRLAGPEIFLRARVFDATEAHAKAARQILRTLKAEFVGLALQDVTDEFPVVGPDNPRRSVCGHEFYFVIGVKASNIVLPPPLPILSGLK